MLVCLNGTFIPHEDAQLPISDGGFLFGDTLFETLKAQKQKIVLQKQHLDRLELSAKLLEFPCDRKRIETSLQQLAAALTAPASRIRLTLSRGPCQGLSFPQPGVGWYLLTASPTEEMSSQARQAGAVCVTAPNQRVNPLGHLPQMKRGNYADCLYAANYAQRKNAREAIFVDADNHVLEGSTSNLFAMLEQRLVTPPPGHNILAGIMRRQVIDAAIELGIPVSERSLKKTELLESEEAFICNSLIEILPINSLDGQALNRGQCWESLLKTLQMRIGT